MKENKIRHSRNLGIFTGFYHERYYREGVPQLRGQRPEESHIAKRSMRRIGRTGKKSRRG